MKKIACSKVTILVSFSVFLFALSSCSTSQMAFSLTGNHIILVKAPPSGGANPQKEIAATAMASSDVTLFALPAKNTLTALDNITDRQISSKAPAIPVQNPTYEKTSAGQTNQVPLLSFDPKTKAISKTISFVQKISGKRNTARDNPSQSHNDSDKDQVVAFLLCLFLGVLGIHRFYLGYTWQGVVQLLTAGGFGIWAFIDFIRIITGDLKPKDGEYYNKL